MRAARSIYLQTARRAAVPQLHRVALVPRHAASRSRSLQFRPFFSSSFQNQPVVPFLLADIGEGISEVEVLQWYVQEGATVEQFTPLCEVQSDKATVPISSRYAGVVKKLHYKVNEMAKVGSPLCDIEVDEKDAASIPPGNGHGAAKSSSTSSTSSSSSSSSSEVTQEIMTSKGPRIILAAPAVRSLAKQKNVNLAQVKGSGKDGRVTKGDLLSFLEGKPQSQADIATSSSSSASASSSASSSSFQVPIAAAPTPVSPPAGSSASTKMGHPAPKTLVQDQVIPLRGFSRAMVQTMTQSLTIPHLGLSDEIQMNKLVEARTALKPIAQSRGVKLTYMPFFIKAASLALKSYPILNSKLSSNGSEVTLIANHNIAIAVDTPNGLVVPNIKNCENLSVIEIAIELQRIVSLAQSNRLSPDDLTGSTFSLSNIGAIGGTYASPVLVAPQVCIGALGKIQKLPRYDDLGNVVPTHIMNISWSADHRVIDGGSIANFSNLWKQYLEEPASMLFDLR